MLGALAGLGIGFGLDFANGLIGHNYSKDLMSRQNDYNLYMFKNRYQMQTADMRRAGLNPILSAGGSVGTPAGVGIASSHGGGGSHAKQLERVVDRIGELYDAQLKKAKAEAEGAEQDTLSKKIDNLIMSDAGETPLGGSSAKQQENSSPRVTYSADGTPMLDVYIPTASKPVPLWQVMAKAKREGLKEGLRGNRLDNALKDVENRYRQSLQYARDEYPILPSLEVWGSSTKQISEAMKNVGLNIHDIADTFLDVKRLKFGRKDSDRRFNFDRERFDHKRELDWLNYFKRNTKGRRKK